VVVDEVVVVVPGTVVIVDVLGARCTSVTWARAAGRRGHLGIGGKCLTSTADFRPVASLQLKGGWQKFGGLNEAAGVVDVLLCVATPAPVPPVGPGRPG